MHLDMLPEEVEKMLNYANELMEIAEQEAERSYEDVVTHIICVNSRLALSNYLNGFLMRNDVVSPQPASLDVLLDKCRQIDARFNEIDLAPVHCSCQVDGEDYCLEVEQVEDCLKVAQHARSVVMSNAPGF